MITLDSKIEIEEIDVKILIKNLLLIFILNLIQVNSYSNPKVDVKTAILIDYDSESVLYELEPDMQIYPASMTKIMTTIVVLIY